LSDLANITILLVEDENDLRKETAAFLELYYNKVIQATNGREALGLIETLRPDLIISDIRMPIMDGLELVSRLKARSPEIPVIFCTAFTETSYLLKAIELGVTGFVRKPVDTDELLSVIDKVTLPQLQQRKIQELSDELMASIQKQIGEMPSQRTVVEQAGRVARTSFNVLLEGETGTGKSRLATIIHTLSQRRNAPFVTVQMGALPIVHKILNIQIHHIQCIFFDEIAARFNLIAHQDRKYLVRFDDILNLDLQKYAVFRVHRGFPELFRVHLTQTFIALDRQPFFGVFQEEVE
jgi:DNA-binding NtrC family response regulator